MNPKPNNEHLSAWLDGELSDTEAAELEAELDRDPALRAELDALEAVVQFVRQEGPTQAPLGFHHRVMARIDEEFPETSNSWAWLRRPWGLPLEGWVLALAAAAVLLLLVPEWRKDTQEPNVPGEEKELSPAAFELPTPLAKDLAQLPTPKGVEGSSVQVIGKATTEASGSKEKTLKGVPPSKPLPMPVGSAPEGSLPTGPSTEVVSKEGLKVLPEPVPTGSSSGTVEIVQPFEPEGVRYAISSDDPDMKREILSVAARFGGAKDAAGKDVVTALMSNGVEELVVSVKQTDLPSFTAALAKLGYKVHTDRGDELLAGDTIEVSLTLSLGSGASNASADSVPRANRIRASSYEDETSEAW